ncbi:pyridoxal phosphate-dependent aminotransferase [Neomoorella humiferrea]|uniref:pyridoxal phosphate-dependent aminotransferase n=1 Tax=Neomoorella humiferrea TaxID=676965 RepID=UPI003D900683
MGINPMYADLEPSRRFLAERFRHIPITERSQMIAMAKGVPDLISLGRGDPDLRTPSHIIAAAKAAMDAGQTHYTDWAGMPELREAIANKLRLENGLDVDASEIIVTVGGQEAVFLLMFSIINPGDEVIVPEPRYTSYDTAIHAAGGKMIPLITKPENEFQIMAKEVEKLITPRTRALLIISPNNPTGAVMRKENLEALAELAIRHDLIIISDEIYEKLIYDGWKHWSIGSLPGMKERTFTVNGFSKAYSMTGWRVGYVAGPREIIEAMNQLKYAVSICTTSISQAAALAALTGPQDCIEETARIYNERRLVAMKRLDRLGIPYVIPRGAFYIFPEIRKFGLSSFDFCRFILEKAKVLLFPGTAFGEGGEGFVRISLLAPAEQINEAFDRIEKALALL